MKSLAAISLLIAALGVVFVLGVQVERHHADGVVVSQATKWVQAYKGVAAGHVVATLPNDAIEVQLTPYSMTRFRCMLQNQSEDVAIVHISAVRIELPGGSRSVIVDGAGIAWPLPDGRWQLEAQVNGGPVYVDWWLY